MSDGRAADPLVPRVQPARLADCTEIAALAKELLPEAWSESQLSSEIALPEGRVWVARIAARLVGFLVARRELDELHVLLTGVAPDTRRQGVASRLLAVATQTERGLARVHLEVREGNAGGRSFYAAAGFDVAGRRARHYPDGEAAVLMIRDLCRPLFP